jgi:uncharacterized membrane protein YheB (UPF0754 family)
MNEKVWRLVEAGCNLTEISEYFKVTEDAAQVMVSEAKRWAFNKTLKKEVKGKQMKSYIFEGKEYSSVSAIRREWFPHRSDMHVSKYIKMGCTTVKEFVDSEVKVERAGRLAAKRGVANSRLVGKK